MSLPNQSTSTSIARAFAEGRYTDVALHGEECDWRTHAARGLCAVAPSVPVRLGDFDHDEARFYHAATLWIDGRDDESLAMLDRLPQPHARRLLALLRKERIPVLVQQPEFGVPPHVAFSGAMCDQRFDVRNISFGCANFPSFPDRRAIDYTGPGWHPDFFVAQMLEWHYTPLRLDELNCPLFGHTADYDLHYHPVREQMKVFDEIVVTDGSEWIDCRKITGLPITTFPKVFGFADHEFDDLPPVGGRRDIDVFMSGTVLHPYHPDKAFLIHDVLASRARRPLVINGFLNHQDYYRLLLRTNLTLSYYRHAGGLATRAMESLACGAPVLIQRNNVLRLYLQDSAPLIEYDDQAPGGLQAAIDAVLPDIARRVEAAKLESPRIREIFNYRRVGSQYLRYLTVRAALHPRPLVRDPAMDGAQPNRRVVLEKGWLPGGKVATERCALAHADVWARTSGPEADTTILGSAREYVLLHVQGVAGYLAKALALLGDFLARRPRRLVPAFNYARLLVHFGDEDQSRQGLILMDDLLRRPLQGHEFDFEDDIWPYDLWGEHFDYRSYQDALVKDSRRHGDGTRARLIACLRGAMFAYVGTSRNDVQALRQAVECNPEFPRHRLLLARALLCQETLEARQEAASLLDALARGSNLHVEASHLLRTHCAETLTSASRRRLEHLMQRHRSAYLENSTIQRHELADRASRYSCLPRADKPAIVMDRRETSATPAFTLILNHLPGTDSRLILEAMEAVAPLRDDIEIVWVDPFHLPAAAGSDVADCVVASNQSNFDHHVGKSLNAGLLAARGTTILIPHGICADTGRACLDLCRHRGAGADNRILSVRPLGTADLFASAASAADLLTAMVAYDARYVLAVRRSDLLQILGFDESSIFHGEAGGPYEAVARLLNRAHPWELIAPCVPSEPVVRAGVWRAARAWYHDGSTCLRPAWLRKNKRFLSLWKTHFAHAHELPMSINPLMHRAKLEHFTALLSL